jgi:hypothetical protein
MFGTRRKQPPMLPFTVTARRQDKPPIRIGIIAPSVVDATLIAQELFPNQIISIASIEPKWQDDPA